MCVTEEKEMSNSINDLLYEQFLETLDEERELTYAQLEILFNRWIEERGEA